MFFDRPMLLEVPLEAAAASAAASPVWVAVDFDRACGVRRRGVRWRSRAGLFAAPLSTFAGLFARLRGCLVAIVFILWIRIALRDACTTTSPALGARRVATQETANDMDSNASRAGYLRPRVTGRIAARRDHPVCGSQALRIFIRRRPYLRNLRLSANFLARAPSMACGFRKVAPELPTEDGRMRHFWA